MLVTFNITRKVLDRREIKLDRCDKCAIAYVANQILVIPKDAFAYVNYDSLSIVIAGIDLVELALPDRVVKWQMRYHLLPAKKNPPITFKLNVPYRYVKRPKAKRRVKR